MDDGGVHETLLSSYTFPMRTDPNMTGSGGQSPLVLKSRLDLDNPVSALRPPHYLSPYFR